MMHKRTTRRSLLSVVLAILLLLSFTGCEELLELDLPSLDFFDDENGETTSSNDSKDDLINLPFDPSNPPFTSDCPTLSNSKELRDYLCYSVESGNHEPKFCYTGDENDLEPQNVARILSAYYVWVQELSVEEGIWQVRYTGYPGDRIVAAHRSGDTSALTADEKDALEVALDVVADAKAASSDLMETELYLHDWLCDKVTYFKGSVDVESEDQILPHLTALGALLEGKANCQGYTDGFYVLASLAGFTVGRQSCDTPDGGHSFNTICLGGKWYVVDVTFNDDSYYYEGEYYHDYRLFNAGEAECGEYTWPEEYEYHSLEKTGGDVYYYNLTDGSYTKRYTSVKAVANAIAQQWADNKRSEVYMMLAGKKATWKDLNLSEVLDQTGVAYNYVVWSITAGENTYFYVRFQ